MREEADFSSGQRGATLSPAPQARRPIALDPDVLRWFEDVALRISRLGWRALLTYVGILAVLAVWGELAAHDRRRARSRDP